ncbi:MAG: hypothetical protein E6276_01270 [Clostridiales bacterium]|nr:hypothetical protein [Clostridiales bacterium]
MKQMYQGMANSPETFLTESLVSGNNIMYISDASILPELPTLAVIGKDQKPETVKILSKRNDGGFNIERAVEGFARDWGKGEVIARNFTNHDYQTLIDNVGELDSNISKLDSNKVDKVNGKQLSTNDFTDTQKEKLAGLSNYIHPATHPATMITQDNTHRFVTDSEKSTWNNKANQTDLDDLKKLSAECVNEMAQTLSKARIVPNSEKTLKDIKEAIVRWIKPFDVNKNIYVYPEEKWNYQRHYLTIRSVPIEVTLYKGTFLSENITIRTDVPELKPENIKKGVTVGEVTGSYEPTLKVVYPEPWEGNSGKIFTFGTKIFAVVGINLLNGGFYQWGNFERNDGFVAIREGEKVRFLNDEDLEKFYPNATWDSMNFIWQVLKKKDENQLFLHQGRNHEYKQGDLAVLYYE